MQTIPLWLRLQSCWYCLMNVFMENEDDTICFIRTLYPDKCVWIYNVDIISIQCLFVKWYDLTFINILHVFFFDQILKVYEYYMNIVKWFCNWNLSFICMPLSEWEFDFQLHRIYLQKFYIFTQSLKICPLDILVRYQLKLDHW